MHNYSMQLIQNPINRIHVKANIFYEIITDNFTAQTVRRGYYGGGGIWILLDLSTAFDNIVHHKQFHLFDEYNME